MGWWSLGKLHERRKVVERPDPLDATAGGTEMNIIETMKQALEDVQDFGVLRARTITNLRTTIAECEKVEPVMFDDWPEYHAQGMGCGLEDRGITDRYDAMRYGWDEAIERVAERLDGFLHPAPAAPQWQPIETASKKGLVTIWIEWGDAPGECWLYCYYDHVCGEWRTTRPSGHLRCVAERFVTHFMPPLTPPEPKSPTVQVVTESKE